MARIRKKGNKYHLDYRLGGRRIRQRFDSREQAQAALLEAQVEITRQKTGQKRVTLQKFFNAITKHISNSVLSSSQRRYRVIIENFRRFLASEHLILKFISEIQPAAIEEYIRFRQKEGRHARTIRAELTVLRKMFRLAVERDELVVNPLDAVSYKEVKREVRLRVLSLAVQKLLLERADQWFYPILYTFLQTGIRKAELEDMRWGQIDFQEKVIRIKARDGRTPEEHQRNIPIHAGLIYVFKQHKDRFQKAGLKTENKHFIFTDKSGKPLAAHCIRYQLIKLCKACGIEAITHADVLRHSFAYQLIQSGADLSVLQQVMGHATIQSTQIYSQWIKPSLQSVMEKMNRKT